MAKKKEGEKQSGDKKEEEEKGGGPSGENSHGDEEPNFSDPESYVDEIRDEDLLGDLLKQKPKETDGVEAVIVVDGIPEVGPDRQEKLKNTIHKVFSKFGNIINEYYPVGAEGKTKGYIFLEYSSPANALEAVKTTNGYKLDKHHIFSVYLFTDFEKYESIPDEWTSPEPQPYKDQGNMSFYLLEPDACDQYSILNEGGEKLQIYLNSVPERALLEERARWTETYVRWSPLGTYLATFHSKGIALWGGERFKQIIKFSHPGVQFIDFSPCEKYLVMFSPMNESHGDNPQSIVIFEIRTGINRRSFMHSEGPSVWPIFKWSHDDRYFARMSQDLLSVYETPSFGLLEKKSIKVPGIRDFSWSPTENLVAYWVAEEKDVPSRVVLLEIPSRAEIRAKNLFNVADCKMHWQKSGDFLCVKVDRYSKVKKEKNEVKFSGIHYNFEIFHMREKQVPVDSVEIKEPVQAFAWEPVGSKFSVIHGELPNICVSFYGVKTGQAPVMLKKYERKQCNHLFWAPQGQFIVLAGLRNMNGVLEFVDTSDFTVMNTTEHFMATDVEWDPTGRYIATAVSWWGHKVDNAYWMWSFQGRILKRYNMERFCQLLWRPRPPTLLGQQDVRDIRRNMKKYSAQFEQKDRVRLNKASKELVDKRRRLMEEYREYRQRKEEQHQSQKKRRLELRNNVDTDGLDAEQSNLDEEEVEFFIKEEETIVEE